MKRVFKDGGVGMPGTVEAAMVRMQELGATAAECLEMRMTMEAFERWSGRRGWMADREAGLVWLQEIRERMQPEAYAAAKAGLTTWFHLTGAARVGEEAWSLEAAWNFRRNVVHLGAGCSFRQKFPGMG